MSFRSRMAKSKGKKSLGRRHQAGTKTTGGSRYPTIFLKDKVPEGIEFFFSKEGDHLVDIIPFEAGPDMPFDERLQPITDEGDLDYVLDLFVHLNVGTMQKPYVCPYENFGLPCPICEFMKATKLEKEDWKKLVAKHRVVYFLWVHNSREEEKKGIQIYESSHYSMEEKIEVIAKLPEEGGFIKFSDPDNGKTLAFTRKGSGFENTQYLGHRFIKRKSQIPDRILDQTFPLDSIVNMHPTYEEIEKEFRGTLKAMKLLDEDETDEPEDDDPWGGEEDIDDSDFDAPKKKRRKKPTDRKTNKSEGKSTTVKKKKRRRR